MGAVRFLLRHYNSSLKTAIPNFSKAPNRQYWGACQSDAKRPPLAPMVLVLKPGAWHESWPWSDSSVLFPGCFDAFTDPLYRILFRFSTPVPSMGRRRPSSYIFGALASGIFFALFVPTLFSGTYRNVQFLVFFRDTVSFCRRICLLFNSIDRFRL